MIYLSRIWVVLVVALLAWSCDSDSDGGEVNSSPEICDDGKDNDDDGAVDCDDAECQTTPECEPERDPIFHVFLLLGQSNMVGYPTPEDEDLAEDERVEVLGLSNCSRTGRETDVWDIASPPLHNCSDGLGPGDYFAKTLIEALPEGDTIGLIPNAVNGQGIDDFIKGTDRYDRIIERAEIAQDDGGVISGILFHQGETNNGQSTWPDKVNTLVEDIKSDLGLGDIPFLAGELLYTGSCAGHNALINGLPEVVTNAHVVSAEGLEVDPTDTEWELHFGREAQVEFGKRYAEKMIEVLDVE